ncbi:MAG: hypothetical protein Q7V17_04990 [Afipia sp.]|nr:hypothetical protein [Afipia sp.]
MEKLPPQRSSEGLLSAARADEALEDARQLPHGAARTEALRKAGMLRNAADKHGLVFAPKGRPAK